MKNSLCKYRKKLHRFVAEQAIGHGHFVAVTNNRKQQATTQDSTEL